mmetsp:Transcript_7063/g.14243  ORF Transcript_7063/g.14243 Transcript_7063/m.14243 type:complete len:216 (+) Transcript_7063:2109-2756(+)
MTLLLRCNAVRVALLEGGDDVRLLLRGVHLLVAQRALPLGVARAHGRLVLRLRRLQCLLHAPLRRHLRRLHLAAVRRLQQLQLARAPLVVLRLQVTRVLLVLIVHGDAQVHQLAAVLRLELLLLALVVGLGGGKGAAVVPLEGLLLLRQRRLLRALRLVARGGHGLRVLVGDALDHVAVLALARHRHRRVAALPLRRQPLHVNLMLRLLPSQLGC